MKFGFKIFLVSFLIMIISFGTGGFLLVNSVFNHNFERITASDFENNRYIAASLDAVIKNGKSMGFDNNSINFTVESFRSQMEGKRGDTEVKICAKNKTFLYDRDSFVNKLGHYGYGSKIYHEDGKYYYQVVTCIVPASTPICVETLTDITSIFEERESYIGTFQLVLIAVAAVASAMLWAFSYYITRPLNKLKKAAGEIASGDYSVRADFSLRKAGSEEVYALGNSFDTMAESMELHVEKLKEETRRRDDFVGNFTHELKTPLTSVIGYSDMLRSYDLTEEKRRECAELIYKEGKRLEALSINLLDLMVLKKEGVKFEKLSSEALFEDTEKALKFLLEKYGVSLKISSEECLVLGEPSLVKTLIYNLVDNGAKASKPQDEIEISGIREGDKYRITVRDRGRGIPKEEIDKILEPFYMVDKSRARKQGGAGLGLALCSELARLHQGNLQIESLENKGTDVSFTLPVCKEEKK
ncbi:MAG: sensor histidine kinase [Ruminococcus sp.]